MSKRDDTISNLFSNKMDIDFDVFSAIVKNIIISNVYCTDVVTINVTVGKLYPRLLRSV